MDGMPVCPECGEAMVVCRVEEGPYDIVGEVAMLKVTQLDIPPYCPFCGHAWWRRELAEEAERVIENG